LELRLLAKNQCAVKLPNGTFSKIIKETKQTYGLDEGSINFQTKKSQVFAHISREINHQKISPLAAIEGVIVDRCCRLSAMGETLTKTEVMCLADDILTDSVHVDTYVNFCNRRNINKDVSKGEIVGNR
jgi:hypothetical protein